MKGDREQMEALRGEKARLEAERARLAEETDRLAAEKAELAETEGSLRSANLLLEQQKHQLTDQVGTRRRVGAHLGAYMGRSRGGELPTVRRR